MWTVVPALSIDAIRSRLEAFSAQRRFPIEGLMKQAAVSAVLRQRGPQGPELLFIRRAEHPSDPWSGHMAFPGGRVDGGDRDPLAAAIREADEELALDLTRDARRLGDLSHVMAMAHGKPLPMVIHPFVFELTAEPELRPNREVGEVLWVPLEHFIDEANRTTLEWKRAGVPIRLPCYRWDGKPIWGLTLKMVDELVSIIRPG